MIGRARLVDARSEGGTDEAARLVQKEHRSAKHAKDCKLIVN